jgi:protein-S-isoprenylcysteine O-methyltransferase Ste14
VIFGDILIALAYVGFYRVFRENTYGGATIELTPGPNGRDDRPLRGGPPPDVPLGAPDASGYSPLLGLLVGALLLVPALAAILWRLREEERFLLTELPGYRDYQRKVRHRLIPLA